MPKLTKNFIETKVERPEKGKRIYYRDKELPGFGLIVRHNSTSYFVEKRINGVSRRVMIGRYPLLSPDSARTEAMKMLGSMAAGQDPVKTRDIKKTVSLTLRQAFEEYMQSKEFRPGTRYSYPRLMTNKLGDWLDKPVLAITRDMVAERFKQLSTQGTKTGHSGKCTANTTMEILRAILNYVSYKYEVDGMPLIPANPVYRLTQTRAWHKLPVRQGVIPIHKLPLFYKAVMSLSNPTARDYYIALLLTGLRRNELPQLVWSDIDFEGRSLHVRKEVVKQGSAYSLPLSDFLYDLFARRHAERNGSDYVFPAYRMKGGRYYGCYTTLKKLRAEIGCHFITHDTRRTFLTVAESLGIPPYSLKRLVGHSITEDVTAGYLVINVERLREPMQRITDKFLELMEVDAVPEMAVSLIEETEFDDCMDAWRTAVMG